MKLDFFALHVGIRFEEIGSFVNGVFIDAWPIVVTFLLFNMFCGCWEMMETLVFATHYMSNHKFAGSRRSICYTSRHALFATILGVCFLCVWGDHGPLWGCSIKCLGLFDGHFSGPMRRSGPFRFRVSWMSQLLFSSVQFSSVQLLSHGLYSRDRR